MKGYCGARKGLILAHCTSLQVVDMLCEEAVVMVVVTAAVAVLVLLVVASAGANAFVGCAREPRGWGG